jgi:hypothetical protein
MSWKVFTAALLVTLTMAGGTAAMTDTGPMATPDATAATGEADIDATYANGTVTVTVTQGDAPVKGAAVEMADGEYTTDANGTVTADVGDIDELDVEVEADGFEGEVGYAVADGTLTLQEEEYE